MHKKLLLLCSQGFPGSYKVITNLQRVLDGLVNARVLPIEELYTFRPRLGNLRIKRRLRKIQADLQMISVDRISEYGDNILFTAWGPPYDVALKKLNKMGITPSLIMCSTPGQSELSRHELKDYHSILGYLETGKLRHWLLNKRLYNALAGITRHAVYFPHTLDVGQFKGVTPLKLDGTNIDLFCPLRLGKNLLNQVLAFKLSGVSGRLHINFSDDLIDPVIRDIGANIVKHRWIAAGQYYELVAAMDLSLQATFTESFNYAVAERMYLGVPVITSYDIYLTAGDEFLSKHLCVKALDSPSEIAAMIKRIATDAKLRAALSRRCTKVMSRIAERNNREARDYIIEFLK